MIRAVFDTNVFFQSSISRKGPAYACWEFVEAGFVKVWTTEAILEELAEILNREHLRRRLESTAEGRTIESVLATIRENSFIAEPPRQYFEVERDKDDSVFINLALAVRAEFLVSRDKDLLSLQTDSDFNKSFPELKIVNPYRFLAAVRAKL